MSHVLFLLLAPLALAVVLGVGGLAWRRLRGPLRYAFLLFSAAESGWILAATARLVATSAPVMERLTEAIYVSAAAAVVGWLWFALLYARRWRPTTQVLLGLYAALASLFVGTVLTNRLHGLAWTLTGYRSDRTFPMIEYAFGPATLVLFPLVWTALFVSLALVLRAYWAASDPYRHVSQWIVAGLLLPVLLNVAFVLQGGTAGADFTPLALAFTSAAMALGLGRDALLDVRPLARTALVEQLREGVLVLDVKGCIADVNPAGRAMLGHPGRLLGSHIRDVLSPEQRRAVDEIWGQQMAQTEIPFTVDGDSRYYDLRLSPVDGPDGRPAGSLLLVYDVTELRRQQDALHRTNTLLQSQNAALDDFAHTVAHDLKTSIQHLVGHAELLHEDGPRLSDAEHRDLASGLVRSGLKLDSIVQELLLFAQTRRGTVSPVALDMEAVFGEAMERLRPTLDATGAHVTVTTDWPDVLGYAAWIETVWCNYIGNAAKYGGRPAHVTVCSDSVGADGTVRYWVQDLGPGLTEQDQARLFEPFSRLAQGGGSPEGHGLGLSIVQRILERLGGSCGVESAGVAGGGSRFWFTLPAVPTPSKADQRVAQHPEPGRGSAQHLEDGILAVSRSTR